MRVLEIMGSLHRGGAETMIMNYYRAFDKRLCQMDFVIHARFPEDYCEEASSMGAKIILLDRPGKVGASRYIKELTNAIKSNGPYNAVHIHTGTQAFMGIIAARRAGIKKIIVHSHSTTDAKSKILFNRLVMDFIPVIRLSCGKAAGRALYGNHKFIIINNAINVDKFKGTDKVDYEALKKKLYGNKFVIGHIGRFHPAKNHDFLLDIMAIMKKRKRDVILLLYGEGERESEIRQKVKERGLIDVIKFMGVTNDVVTAYHTFDAFVLPSVYEGFPVTLVESQLSGIHSFASDAVSKECDLELGLLKFLPLDPEVWIDNLIQCSEEKKSSSDITIEKKIISKYDVNVQWKKLYRIYSR